MEIEIITTSAVENPLDPTKKFGITLNEAVTVIKMLHWYVLDHNAHEILGDLYGELNDLFDTLQEEIIGTCEKSGVIFPSLDMKICIEDITGYSNNQTILNEFHNVSNTIKNILTSLEFNNYITSVKSGINNTRDDIITSLNKAEYLLSMIKF